VVALFVCVGAVMDWQFIQGGDQNPLDPEEDEASMESK